MSLLSRKNKPANFVGRFRIEPRTREQLEKMYDILGDPERPLRPTDRSMIGLFEPFYASGIPGAMFIIERAIKRKVIKPYNIDLIDLTINVRNIPNLPDDGWMDELPSYWTDGLGRLESFAGQEDEDES